MTERALELLCLPDEPCYLLDLGCGSGLSGECIEEQVIFMDNLEHFCISWCHLRATIGLVLTSPLPCWGLPMRGSWRAILLVEILEKDFRSGFWKDFELKVIRFC